MNKIKWLECLNRKSNLMWGTGGAGDNNTSQQASMACALLMLKSYPCAIINQVALYLYYFHSLKLIAMKGAIVLKRPWALS